MYQSYLSPTANHQLPLPDDCRRALSPWVLPSPWLRTGPLSRSCRCGSELIYSLSKPPTYPPPHLSHSPHTQVGDLFVLNCLGEEDYAGTMKHFLKRFAPGGWSADRDGCGQEWVWKAIKELRRVKHLSLKGEARLERRRNIPRTHTLISSLIYPL